MLNVVRLWVGGLHDRWSVLQSVLCQAHLFRYPITKLRFVVQADHGAKRN